MTPPALPALPSVIFLEVRHDLDCPGAHGGPASCCCSPDYEQHQDAARFARSMQKNRAQRREAERAARATIRRVSKKR